MSSLFFTSSFARRLKHDSAGHAIRLDGQPITIPEGGATYPVGYFQTERDYLAELQAEWPGYSFVFVGACFVVYSVIVRLRPLPTANIPNDRNA